MRKQICIPSDTGCSLKVYRFASAPFIYLQICIIGDEPDKSRAVTNSLNFRSLMIISVKHLLKVLQVSKDVHGDDVLQGDHIHGCVFDTGPVALVETNHLVIE